jgi:hypothetical protein
MLIGRLIGTKAMANPALSAVRYEGGSWSIKVRFHVTTVKAAVAIAFVGAVSLTACSSGKSSSTSSNGLSGKTPAQVVAVVQAAATAKGSMHWVAENCVLIGTCVTDVASGTGRQTISTTSGGNATFVVLPNMAYLQADATWLTQQMSFTPKSASIYAGKWMSDPSTDVTNYQNWSLGVTFQSTLENLLPTGTPATPLAFAKASTFDGKSVIGVSGAIPSGTGPTGSEVLYISTAAPYLPVGEVTHITINAKSGAETVRYSDWGKPISVKAPANAIPFSSVNGLQS